MKASFVKSKKCSLCRKYNDFHQTLVYCHSYACAAWLHASCYTERYKKDHTESYWLCNKHLDAQAVDTSPSSSEKSESFVSQNNSMKIDPPPDQDQKSCADCGEPIIDAKYHTCSLCKHFRHDACLSRIELKTLNDELNAFVCSDCLLSHAKKSMSKKDDDSSISSDDDDDEVKEESKDLPRPSITQNLCTNNANDFFLKQSLRQLPQVIDDGTSWQIFYSAYKQTKQLFSDHENIIRIQEAIKHPKVKSIGGDNLLIPETYEKALEKINGRLKNNLNSVWKEANDIEAHAPLKNNQKTKIIDFIDKLRNFNDKALAFKEDSYLKNKKFLANISNILPHFLRNLWEKKQAKLEAKGKIVSLEKMVALLEEQIPVLEISLRNEALQNDKIEKDKQKTDRSRITKGLNHSTKSDNIKKSLNNNTNNTYTPNTSNKCWLPDHDSHPFYKCKTLWNMKGKEVTESARQHGICTYCGLNWSSHKSCPKKSKYKCRTIGCSYPHHELFCFKRKVETQKVNNHNSNVSKEKTFDKKKDTSQDNICEDEVMQMMREIGDSNLYTNIDSTPAHSSQDTRFSQHYRSNVNVLDENNLSYSKNSVKETNYAPPSTLLGIIVVTLNNQKEVALMIDSGSTVSVIEESIANDLKAPGLWSPLRLYWSGDQNRCDKFSRIIKIEAKNNVDEKTYTVCFRTVRDLNVCSQTFRAADYQKMYKHLAPLKLKDYDKIHGIIGLDNPFVFEHLKFFKTKGSKVAPYGIRCALGDYVIGTSCPLIDVYDRLSKEKVYVTKECRFNSHFTLTESEQKELLEMEQETMGLDYKIPRDTADRKIAEDEYALKLLEKSVKRKKNSSHYEAPLLWSSNDIKLPTYDSFKVALRRYMIVEKNALRLNKFDECIDQIKNLLSKGYAKELSDEEIKQVTDKSYYNPIFFLHPKNKRSRMIWDLAAKVNGKALNDYLIAGPNLYSNLLHMLFQMREYEYMFKGDLSEMFHQIHVNDDDTEALRFLFRFSPEEKIRVFKLLVLPFGAKSSPTISQFVKNKIAEDNSNQYPLACDVITKNCYVDDVVKSISSLEDAKMLPVDVKRILQKGGFNLVKINSNSKDIVQFVKSKMTEQELADEKLFSTDEKEKLLGYDVNFARDEISVSFSLDKFPAKIISGEDRPTKRQVLQIMMTLYDPIGFLQFLTSKLKLLYHKLCQNNYDWDQSLNDEHQATWQKCLEWLKEINLISIPRLYSLHVNSAEKIQLWAFGDSGQEIACGVLFLRFLDSKNNQLDYKLIYAKSFTTPLNQKRSIPELELNVAHKICEMAQEVKKSHTIRIDETIYATDNAAVKYWITNNPKKPTVYVKNRVEKIHKSTKTSEWIWLPTGYMPADFGTKFSAMPEMSYENDWFHPILFRLPEKSWPSFQPNKEEIEVQLNAHFAIKPLIENEEGFLEPSKFHKFHSLISTCQLAFRWLHLTRNERKLKDINAMRLELKDDPHNRSLKTKISEMSADYTATKLKIRKINFMYERAENIILSLAQKDGFQEELKLLKAGKELPKKHWLYKLTPKIDQNGLIRVTTRIPVNDSNINSFGYNAIRPILLPKSHAITSLIVLKYHENCKHILNDSVIANLLKKFYIPHIRWTVNKIIKQKCMYCRRHKARPEMPMMGDIPAFKLEHHIPPFTNVMIDLAGPITVNVHRNVTDKRYIFVYSCLNTKAIHLELIQKLDTDNTLIALSNTINLRGAPKLVISDNGTNFQGAKSFLSNSEDCWNRKLLEKGIINTPIKWTFGPPRSPHSQGQVERMIGVVKNALKHITNMIPTRKKLFNDFMLRAVLTEIVALINNRPLSLVPIEGTNHQILTPNYFLLGRQTIQTIASPELSTKTLKDTFEDLKIISNILWNHWIKVYLPTIIAREKWIDKKNPLEVGDIVLTVDTGVANSWRMGRVMEVKIGSQNQAREYKVLLGKNDILSDVKSISQKRLLELYKNEKMSIVTRGAVAIAKIDVNVISM